MPPVAGRLRPASPIRLGGDSYAGAWMRGLLTLTMTILLAAPAMAGPTAMTADQAMKAATDSRSLSLARKIHLLADAGDATGLAHHMAAMKADPGLSDPARERLLHESAMAAARLQPDNALEAEIGALAIYQSRTLIWADEHGYRETRPLYDFAATTRHVRRLWTEEWSRSRTVHLLAAGDIDIVDQYARAPVAERVGAAAAFREAPVGQLTVLQPVLMNALEQGGAVDGLAIIVAAKIHDAALMEKVLSEGTADTARQAIDTIQSPEWAGESSRLLEAAATRQDVASAAVLALGRLGATDRGAVDFLFRSLGGLSGPSAAAALARLGDGNIVSRLSDLLRSEGDETIRRNALLGLRLADSPAAAEALAAFARDPDAPSRLVAEVPQWLRD